MKSFWFAILIFIGSLFQTTIASAQNASGALLQEMSRASRSLNYELSFISVSKAGIESLRYRHALIGQQPLAQLLQMDGPRREILQRGSDISYFESGLEPFTLSGDHIVDSLPPVVFADFDLLYKSFDFISVGRTRIVDRLCDVVRIVPRDGTRYSYIIWIDSSTKLPLRSDLLDRNGETLEQFRVISLVVDDEVKSVMEGLIKANLPPLLSISATEEVTYDWQAGWLPAGVAEASRSRRTLPNISTPIESRLFTDGVFSFSVNVSRGVSGGTEQNLRQGRRTIHTETRNNIEITVVGELPPATAKRIADGIVFKAKP